MLTSTAFSQDLISEIPVKKNILENIARYVEKCDSLRVAYELKSITLDEVIESNKTLLLQLEENSKKTAIITQNLKDANEKIANMSESFNNKIFNFGLGALIGLVIGVLIPVLF